MWKADAFSQKADSLDSIRKEETKELLKALVSQFDSAKIDSLKQHSKDIKLGISGMIIDNTKTKAGRDFYTKFYNQWTTSGIQNRHMIRISEEPYRLRSTIIRVSVDDKVIFSSLLQPRESIIESMSQEAFYQVRGYVENYEAIMRQIGSDDTSGDGIY